MESKTILITGGSSGIGKATAIGLAKLGAEIIIAARNRKSAEAVIEEIKQQTGNSNISFLPIDLSSQDSVKEAAKEFLSSHSKLDVLINNAGIYKRTRTETRDGIETVFAVNYLSHFLLTKLLLPALRKSKQGRIINVASKHRGIKMNLDDLMQSNHYSPFMALGQTKLALIIFTKELAKRLKGTNITVNSLHPAVVNTSLLAEFPRLMQFLIGLMGSDTQEAAKTSIYLASSNDVNDVSGEYFEKCKIKSTQKNANSSRFNDKLWQESLRLTGINSF